MYTLTLPYLSALKTATLHQYIQTIPLTPPCNNLSALDITTFSKYIQSIPSTPPCVNFSAL